MQCELVGIFGTPLAPEPCQAGICPRGPGVLKLQMDLDSSLPPPGGRQVLHLSTSVPRKGSSVPESCWFRGDSEELTGPSLCFQA